MCIYTYDIMCICWSDCCMCPKSLYACVRYVLANWNFVQSENKDNIRSNINIMRHEMMKRYIMRTLGKHRDHSIFVFANKKTPDIPHKKGTINRRQLDTYINDICSEFRTLIGTAHTKVVFFFFIIFNPKHCFTLRQTTCCFAQGISIRTQQQQNRWFPQKFGTELDWLCKCGEISIAPFTRSIERNFHIHRAQFRCGTWTIITYDGTMISEFIREITRAILPTIDAVGQCAMLAPHMNGRLALWGAECGRFPQHNKSIVFNTYFFLSSSISAVALLLHSIWWGKKLVEIVASAESSSQ